eukprot:scaffold84385_cov54-Phaeocystis_antarctica.AAC.1
MVARRFHCGCPSGSGKRLAWEGLGEATRLGGAGPQLRAAAQAGRLGGSSTRGGRLVEVGWQAGLGEATHVDVGGAHDL